MRSLTDPEVRALREEFAALVTSGTRWSFIAFAQQHGMHASSVIHLIRGHSRKHAGGPLFTGRARNYGSPRTHRRLGGDAVEFIRWQWYSRRMSIRVLAERFAVSHSVIEGVIYGETYREFGGPVAVRGARQPWVAAHRGFSDEQRAAVTRSVLDEGMAIKSAAALHGVSVNWAQRVVFNARMERSKGVEAAE